MVYHVLNRANSRRRLFYTDKDYLAFLQVLLEAHRRFPGVQILALCVMPNHWHLVLSPGEDGELSRFMRWLTQTHTQRWRHAKRTVGHGALYQGRYKSFVVQADDHFLILCRYVERNALRGKRVTRAEAWRWGSAWIRQHGNAELKALLSEWPLDRPSNWTRLLNEQQNDKAPEAVSVRTSIERNRPLGTPRWVKSTARRLGLTHTLRSPGRPPKRRDKSGDASDDETAKS
jgi:putative transposase